MICLPYRTDKLQMNYMRCCKTFLTINIMEEEKYKCLECKKECLESELLEDDYAQYKGFSEELFCPHCKARVD